MSDFLQIYDSNGPPGENGNIMQDTQAIVEEELIDNQETETPIAFPGTASQQIPIQKPPSSSSNTLRFQRTPSRAKQEVLGASGVEQHESSIQIMNPHPLPPNVTVNT